MHERYEQQIICKLKTAKLTGINRHNESYEALIPNVVEFQKNDKINSIQIYKRGKIKNNFNPELVYPSQLYTSCIYAIENERLNDLIDTFSEFDDRYNYILKQMEKRIAPQEQINQLDSIKEEVQNSIASNIIEENIAKVTIEYSKEKDEEKIKLLKDKLDVLHAIKQYIYNGNTQMINKIIKSKNKGVL